MLLGLIFLVIGGEYLVRASVSLSFKLNLPKIVIGLTVVSFATSLPELLVSLNAALQGSSAIAINNVVGSNIANIGLILSIMAIFSTIEVKNLFYQFNWPSLIFFSILLYLFIWDDYKIVAYEGLILFIFLLLFIFILLRKSKSHVLENNIEINELEIATNFKILFWFIIGSISLYFGAEWLVDGAIHIAKTIGISEAVVSVSLVAFGTSIPELSTSIIAILKNEKAISIGNLIGSNVFNIGSVLGLTAMVSNIEVTDKLILHRDVVWMIIFAAIILPLVLIKKRNKLQSKEGFFLLVLYGVFLITIFK
mgnify:CR=1 FL=1